MATGKIPLRTRPRPRPTFSQRSPSLQHDHTNQGGSACMEVAAPPRVRRFSSSPRSGHGGRGGTISPGGNGGHEGRGDVVLALPAARHLGPVCSKSLDLAKALIGHKRSCRPPAPAVFADPLAQLPQQQKEKRPRVTAETRWTRTKPRSARVRRSMLSDSIPNSAVLSVGPTKMVINDDKEEEAGMAIVENIAIRDRHAPTAVAIVPAVPTLPMAGLGAMAFWTASAASAAAFDHGDGSASGVQMSFQQNKDKELQARTLDATGAVAATKDLRWYVCEMCGNKYERRGGLCGHYMTDHLKPPVFRCIHLFGVKIFILQF